MQDKKTKSELYSGKSCRRETKEGIQENKNSIILTRITQGHRQQMKEKKNYKNKTRLETNKQSTKNK